jgi:prepilin-type N-terminal cleavage/methylation domain-containing protein/prepilin-type processing-associated H-X9-DG protein
MTRTRAIRVRAFTLVELLVVIAIIGVLMGLLLPAVQSAREAGRRTTCTNNQYQMALAASRFNDSNGFLPGWRNAMALTGTTITPSWPVLLLPFMERLDIFRTVSAGNSIAALTGMQTYVSAFVCPSSPTSSMTGPALAYAGNCGTSVNANRWDGVMLDTSGTTAATRVTVSVEDIASADGSTNTLILSEKCGANAMNVSDPPHTWAMVPGASWTFALGAAAVPGFGVGADSAPSKIINSGSAQTLPGFFSQPSSNHPGGAVVAFCDGRAGFLKDALPTHVYAQLLTPNSVWNPATSLYSSNSARMNNWLKATGAPQPYVLSEGDFQ